MNRRDDRLLKWIGEEVAATREEVALTREEVRLSREQRVRSDVIMDRVEATLQRHAEQHDDLRTFIREMTLRIHRGTQEMSASMRAFRAEIQADMRAAREEDRAARAEMREEMREVRAESRAHTSALLRLMDRLDGPQPGGAAGAA